MTTIRRQIIDILENGERTAIDISQEVRISEKDVYEHLPHVARSVAAQGKRIVIKPPQCLKCGFVFENRSRFKPPGRCPICRETHIQKPTYGIV